MDRSAGVGAAKPGLAAQVGDDRGTSGSGSPCCSTTARTARPFGCWSIAWTRSGGDAASDPAIEFASRPKRHATETGKAVHGQFERILKSAQEDAAVRGIRIEKGADEESADKAEGEAEEAGKGGKGHQAYRRIVPRRPTGLFVSRPNAGAPRARGPRARRPMDWPRRRSSTSSSPGTAAGRRSRGTTGKRAYCPKCERHYNPPASPTGQSAAFGHAFQAWTVYQRVVLRLPYRIITQVTEHLFGVGLSAVTVVNFLKYLAELLRPDRGGHPPGDPQERLRPRR